jgi:hypothetical protein
MTTDQLMKWARLMVQHSAPCDVLLSLDALIGTLIEQEGANEISECSPTLLGLALLARRVELLTIEQADRPGSNVVSIHALPAVLSDTLSPLCDSALCGRNRG